MTWRAFFANFMMVIVSCSKLNSAFKASSRSNAQLQKNHITAFLIANPISHRTPSQEISSRRRVSSCILQMSGSAEKLSSNQMRTITIGVNERYIQKRDVNASESDDFVTTTSFVPLVLTLTGKRVEMKWDYTISPRGPVTPAAETAASKTLIKAGEFTTSFQLTALRLAEIAAMCSPPQMKLSADLLLKEEELENEKKTEIKVEEMVIIKNEKKELSPERLAAIKKMEIAENLLKNGPEKMMVEQALSLRKQMLVDKIVNNGWRMRNLADKLRIAYDAGSTLPELCMRYDLPPVAIFREILRYRVTGHKKFSKLREKDLKALVKQGLRGDGPAYDELMTNRDKKELVDAKALDNMSWVEEDNSERLMSTAWEDSLYDFLDSKNISYVNEQTFKDAGSKSTPDCVFLDDCYINGKLVRWIDMKCFYGTSCSSHFVSKLQKQAKRYDEEFQGPGAIIYKLGFSAALPGKLPETLFLDRGPLGSANPLLTSDNILLVDQLN